jgi:hypothetical protein
MRTSLCDHLFKAHKRQTRQTRGERDVRHKTDKCTSLLGSDSGTFSMGFFLPDFSSHKPFFIKFADHLTLLFGENWDGKALTPLLDNVCQCSEVGLANSHQLLVCVLVLHQLLVSSFFLFSKTFSNTLQHSH